LDFNRHTVGREVDAGVAVLLLCVGFEGRGDLEVGVGTMEMLLGTEILFEVHFG